MGSVKGMARRPSVRSDAERDRLVEENISLAGLCAGKYWGSMPRVVQLRYTFDEARSDAMLGLLRAAELYEESKGAFSTYAYRWCGQAMQRGRACSLVVRVPQKVQDRNTPETISGFWEPEGDFAELPWEAEFVDTDRCISMDVRAALVRLPGRMREAIDLYLDGVGLIESSRRMGVSKQRVTQTIRKASARMRGQLSGYYED